MSPLEKSYYNHELIGGDEPTKDNLTVDKLTSDSEVKLPLAKERKLFKAARLAKEYVHDYNLEGACLRLDMELETGKKIYKSHEFAVAIQKCIQIISPEDVITSSEILQGYKRLAFDTLVPPATRLTALDKLNRYVTGLKPLDGLEEDGGMKKAVPVINITLSNGTVDAAKPVIQID